MAKTKKEIDEEFKPSEEAIRSLIKEDNMMIKVLKKRIKRFQLNIKSIKELKEHGYKSSKR